MKLTATTNFPEIARRIGSLGTTVYHQAGVSAMNKTVAKARTRMSREITSEYNVPAAKVKAGLVIKRATFSGGAAHIEASLESPSRYGRAMNVIHFSARQTAAGVTVKIKKVGGRTVLRSAFIANQGRTVFKRSGPTRLPIEPVQTIGIPQMFNAKRIKDVVVEMVRTEFPEQFAREAKYYMSKA